MSALRKVLLLAPLVTLLLLQGVIVFLCVIVASSKYGWHAWAEAQIRSALDRGNARKASARPAPRPRPAPPLNPLP